MTKLMRMLCIAADVCIVIGVVVISLLLYLIIMMLSK